MRRTGRTTGPASPLAGGRGRLRSRPGTPREASGTGIARLDTGARPALLAIPGGYRPDRPAPLAVMLHGAGGTAQHGLDLLVDRADAAGLLVLAPASEHSTWDVIVDDYGVDVEAFDRALEHTFARYAVDPHRLAIGGFSDGASYALSLGLTNGDLFSHVIAFSPGFMAPASVAGEPSIFVSHGTRDAVLPIDRCSRRLVPELGRRGYDVLYREFDGPHTVPEPVRREALDWLLGDGA